MTQDQWGPWIEHDGKGCPCRGQFAHVVFDGIAPFTSGANRRGVAISTTEWIGLVNPEGGDGSWDWGLPYNPVIRYRIRKPRALLDLIELVENLPEPVDA